MTGNEEKLKQVLLNLVTNALEATLPGGKIMITTSLNDKGQAEVSVMNTGQGITDEVRGKIFDPFYSTKSSGLGLGLSISRDIIRAHNGNIKVDCTSKGLTCFTFTVPLYKENNVKMKVTA